MGQLMNVAGRRAAWPRIGGGTNIPSPDHPTRSTSRASILTSTMWPAHGPGSYEKFGALLQQCRINFAGASARAWYQLTHRDLDASAVPGLLRYPRKVLSLQEPIPEVTPTMVDDADVAALKVEGMSRRVCRSPICSGRMGHRLRRFPADTRRRQRSAVSPPAEEDWAETEPGPACLSVEALSIASSAPSQVCRSDAISIGRSDRLSGLRSRQNRKRNGGKDSRRRFHVPFIPAAAMRWQEQTLPTRSSHLKPMPTACSNCQQGTTGQDRGL